MQILIIEDEPAARQNLKRELLQLAPEMNVVAELDTVSDSLDYLTAGPPPIDLAFCDIQLGDGVSFHIFEHYTPTFPIIFTTAYDEYALQAFSVNSIDYLLKPLKTSDLARALDRYRERRGAAGLDVDALRIMLQQLEAKPASYKTSFLLSFRNRLVPVATSDLRCVYISHDIVYGQTFSGETYRMNEKLEDVQAQLDPKQFFRVNRQLIVARAAVASLAPEVNGRYLLALRDTQVADRGVKMTVAKARVGEFKAWLVGG